LLSSDNRIGYPCPSILFEDADVLVVNKPAGISVLGERGGGPCLWDWLCEYCRAAGRGKPLPVHRLDKGTSGVLVVALSPRAQRSLTRQFTLRRVHKIYIGVVCGCPDPADAHIDLPLCPGRKGRYRVAGLRSAITVDTGLTPPTWRLPADSPDLGKGFYPSQTHYRIVRRLDGHCLVALHPRTGRTHQLRVHLSWLGWPLRGDGLYDKKAPGADVRLALHCRKMAVLRDWAGEPSARWMVFRAPMPEGMMPA
jgi:tRNA pseudouridine32 synthase/23S rRNA pseudouridine746 synthase/23S rRNA pseudouridine1911/1915/1917 synthase